MDLAYTALFARVCVQQPGCFGALLAACEPALPAGSPGALGVLLTTWLEQLDAATDPAQRKLMGMALAVLIGVLELSLSLVRVHGDDLC